MSQKDGVTFNVTSHGQTGGITAGQVIIGAPRRQLGEPTDSEAFRLRTKPGTQVMLIGYNADNETRGLAGQIHGILHQLGWDVYGVVTAATPPSREFEIWSTGDGDADPLATLASWLDRTGFDVLFHAHEKGNQILVGPAK